MNPHVIIQQSPKLVFFWGCVLLFLFFYYLGTASHKGKKLGGTALIILMCLFCGWAINKLTVKKGIDIGGGSMFIVQLQPGKDKDDKPLPVTRDAVQQAITILDKRLNPNGEKDMTM